MPAAEQKARFGYSVVFKTCGAVKANDRWYDLPECYGCWNEVMISADYKDAKAEVKFW